MSPLLLEPCSRAGAAGRDVQTRWLLRDAGRLATGRGGAWVPSPAPLPVCTGIAHIFSRQCSGRPCCPADHTMLSWAPQGEPWFGVLLPKITDTLTLGKEVVLKL